MFKLRKRSEILRDAISGLSSNSAFGNLSPGSKARAILESITSVLGNISSDLSAGMIESLLPNASGTALDLIGEMVGIQRLSAIRGRVKAADNNLKYYVSSGTFGDINGGSSIIVPAGTEISARGRSDVGGTLIQRGEVTLSAGASEASFAADQVGAISNRGIAANVLKTHDFLNYEDSAFQSLLVINSDGISGRPSESDQNLRFRIANRFQSAAEANEVSIRLNSLLVPGVSDVRIIPNKSGIGSYDVVVFGLSQIVSRDIIQRVQKQLDKHQALGTRGIAVSPRFAGISMRVRIKFIDGAVQSEKNAAANAVIRDMTDFITEVNPGETIYINKLVRVILDAHPSIQDIGDPNKPFEQFLVWRQTSTGDARFSRNLNQNLTIKEDEEAIIEYSIDNPIEVVEA